VVGAGIIGICCALNLQRAGFAVTLYDDKGLAQGCSKGNAGHFATEQVFPLAHSSLLKNYRVCYLIH
jgi:D-amino-acid dehydrogenase